MFERVAIFTRGIWEEALIACETPTQLTPTFILNTDTGYSVTILTKLTYVLRETEGNNACSFCSGKNLSAFSVWLIEHIRSDQGIKSEIKSTVFGYFFLVFWQLAEKEP